MSSYKIKEDLYEGESTILYKAVREEDQQPVIIKVLKDDHPEMVEIEKLKEEFEIAESLNDVSGAVKHYEFTEFEGIPALIIEDFGGVSLDKIIKKERLDLKTFLEIAVRSVETLATIADKDIIHKDIKPQNIIVDMDNNIVKITDFGISAKVSNETHEVNNADSKDLEGTLYYMSPEQTGRMNRSIDYRSDMYSLGATFYEIVTGKLPFKSDDPLELVHYHIAVKPTAPKNIDENVPEVISDIIMKLLAKNPEDRYQSHYGLMKDLEECLNQYEEKGSIDKFPVAQHDISYKLNISQKLYCRDDQLNSIMEIYNRVSTGKNEVVMITGSPGIGKSALLNEANRNLRDSDGYLISLNIDQFKQNIPYSSIASLISDIVNQLLIESSENIENWKYKLDSALSGKGKVLTDIAKSLENIIGEQPILPSIEGKRAQNRLNMVFQDFMGVFAYEEHPIVISADNLHWVDSASIELLSSLLTNLDTNHVMMVGTYQSKDVDDNSPVIQMMNRLTKAEINLTKIELDKLDDESVGKLIAESLVSEPDKVEDLRVQVTAKTNNNPFFINNFITTIYEEGYLKFDKKEAVWKWDLDEIKNIGFSDNVVELTISKIQKLKKSSQRILKLASCIGEKFNIKTLSIINRKSTDADTKNSLSRTIEELQEPIEEGLIVPAQKRKANKIITNYKFIHIRVRDASYALLSDDLKKKIHLVLGRMLKKSLNEDKIDDSIYVLTSHLNKGSELIKNETETVELAKLNALSASQSMKQNSYNQALEYIDKALSLMPDDSFEKYYDEIKKYYNRKAIIKTQLGEFDATEEILRLLLEKSKTKTEKAKMYFELVGVNTNRNKFKDAMIEGRMGLEILGITLPEDEEELKKLASEEDAKIEKNLNGRAPMELLNAKELTDEEMLEASHILINMCSLANNIQNTPLFNACVVMGVNLILEYGNTKQSSYFFIYYASYLGRKNEPDKAYEWGSTAMRLADKYNENDIKISVYNLFAMQINPFKNPFRKSFSILDEAYKIAVDTGNWGNAGVILVNTAGAKINEGENLRATLEYIEEGISFTRRTKNFILVKALTILERCCLNLLGLTESPTSFSDNSFDGEKFLEEMKKTGFGLGVNWWYYFLTESLCVYSEFDLLREKMEEYQETNKLNEDNKFFYTMALTNLYADFSDEEKKKYLEIIKETYEISKKDIESKKDSETDVSRSYLVLAEYSKVIGETSDTMKYYNIAVDKAIAYGNPINVALCNESAARYYIDNEFEFIAKAYMREAKYVYKKWGAEGKVKQIEENYPHLITKVSGSSTQSGLRLDRTITFNTSSDKLDLATIVKSSQTISGEIKLEKLLKKMMSIVIENAGAEKGYLLLDSGGKLYIEAEGAVDSEDIIVLKSIPIEGAVPASIINYAQRTKENVVIEDALNEDMYKSDPYIVKYSPKSILAAPLVNQGKLVGVLYLENNLIVGAFTESKLEVLKMLSSQIAISIENAKFYEDLEQKVAERTAELKKAHEELEKSFDEVNALKVQQDGDYFLTSLLIKPLIVNNAKSKKVNIDFMVDQKKKFQFRKWNEELGGDLCISHSINLQGKKYTAFVNGDAMGKSIQGAGGVIVFGVVYNAYIERTRIKEEIQNYSPTEWVIDCYKELQRTFESFDGSMLISVVMGIVEEDTGHMYYMNAEHPFTMLYRDGKASFIEDEICVHKIGTQIEPPEIPVREFDLQSGDVVIMGSDGRDDILLGYDEETKFRIINDDDTKILKHVENGNGKLEKIEIEVKKSGELTDDFSLLRIGYEEKEEE